MSDDTFRDGLLPKGAENPIVWCERCQKHHRRHTFTQEDYDAVIKQGAENLRDAIDAKIAEEIYRNYRK